MNLDILTITNSQAALHDSFVHDLAAWLTAELGIPVRFVTGGAWDEREERLDRGLIDLGWICGAPYVNKRARGVPMGVLTAPVMSAARYDGRPVYFSDVIVRSDSTVQTFSELRGARWTYNEPNSYSGYHAVRYYLAAHGWNGDFFCESVASGAHTNSVARILDKESDASAIDSTVLETLYTSDPSLRDRLRVVATLGPAPMPPFVAGLHLAPDLRAAITTAMARMHNSDRERQFLHKAQMLHLAPVVDSDYDPIRQQLAVLSRVNL